MPRATLLWCAAWLLLTAAAAHVPSAAAAMPNNQRPGLLPPAGGAWRGAELGSQFLPSEIPSGDTGGAKLAAYHHAYPHTPLHVYRSFNLSISPVSPQARRCRDDQPAGFDLAGNGPQFSVFSSEVRLGTPVRHSQYSDV
jgi:hypothetical protein